MADMTDILFQTIILQDSVNRWNSGDRQAVSRSTETIDLLVIKLHRLRDEIIREVRDWDKHNRPYDERD